MSGSKHPIYANKIIGAGGLGKPLVLMGGNSTETGIVGPVAAMGSYMAMADVAADTLELEEHIGFVYVAALGSNNVLTTATGAALDAYFRSPPVGMVGVLSVRNDDAAQTVTLTAGASGMTVGTGLVGTASSSSWALIKTAADTFEYILMA